MKILFSDLDGTLLTDDKRLMDEDRDAISTMLDNGHKFVITTGRPLVSAKRLATEFGFYRQGFYLVSFNGGLIYDCGSDSALLEQNISVEDAKFIMERAHACGFHAHTYAGDFVVSEYETDQLKTYCRLMKMEYRIVGDVKEFFEQNNALSPMNVVIKPPIKVNVITPGTHTELLEFREEMRKTTQGKLFDVFSKPEMLEFSNLKSNKGDAVRFMANLYKIPLQDTIACGDEENDCPMLLAAGVGVAMANGSPIAKSCANYVTIRDNNHGGVAEVIEKFINLRP
ncbi:MAG: HAD family phosphatase [Fibrobacter sp.]|nr:HAD family phosphatase [Fibrobacter sp.]